MTDAGEHAGLMGSTADLYARVAAKINIASVSRADTIAMAGQIAVKHCGGPDIPYRGGRVDGSLQMRNLLSKLPRPSDCIDTIKLKFRRMEFTNGEIVAISKSIVISFSNVTQLTNTLIHNSPGIPFDGWSTSSKCWNRYQPRVSAF